MGQGRWIWPLAALLLGGVVWLAFRGGPPERPPESPPAVSRPDTRPNDGQPPRTDEGLRQTGPYTIAGVRIVDINTGKTLPIQSVDLRPSLERIRRGDRDRHHNDGAVFQNRSGTLPKKPRGYYREYVVRTPGISGPGPQRLVIGKEGEAYYTPDHYDTFIRLEKRE